MTKWWLAMLAGALMTACGGNVRTVGASEPARYDFGDVAGTWRGSRVPLAAVNVHSASWLAGTAMHFRLAYAEPLRRQSYAESRWSAPPAELLEVFLKRHMLFAQAEFSGSGCRVHLVMDELEQRFDDPRRSLMVLEVRALLLPARATEPLARRVFSIRKEAASQDARGGVAAAGAAARALADDLGGWLNEIVREKPAIVERCRT